jgi:hypothetical protein
MGTGARGRAGPITAAGSVQRCRSDLGSPPAFSAQRPSYGGLLDHAGQIVRPAVVGANDGVRFTAGVRSAAFG